ncbi:MAG TPA: hypothetical protein PLG79_13805, partial [Spirochaetales bacterium]|nr:hypothetical protein [Spirochaetales bacterium]
LFVFLIVVLGKQTNADVLYLKNGEILIGTIKQTTSKGVLYNTFKGEVELAVSDILRTEISIDHLKTIPISIELKDLSVLKGTAVDYDSEIGLFLDIAFGTLTIPLSSINRILEIEQSARFNGNPYHVSAGGGMYFPISGNSNDFNSSWLSILELQISIPGIRGLYGGIQAAYHNADYTANSTTDYYFVSICPEITYKYLDLRIQKGVLNLFIPFITFYTGLTYINISDSNLYPSSYGDIALSFNVKIGSEVIAFKEFSIEIAALFGSILQEETPFNFAGTTLQIGYSF